MFHDLTMPLSAETPVFPGDPPLEINDSDGAASDGGVIKHLALSLLTHTGTHIDVPSHMVAGGKTLDDFSIEAFTGDAMVLDVRGQKVIKPDLANIREGDALFLCTGWSGDPSRKDYFSDFPVLPVDEAKKLVAKKVKLVGFDSPSPDTDPYETHRILLARDILIIENLANLAALVGKRVKFTALPLKVQKADGAPCRVIAEV